MSEPPFRHIGGESGREDLNDGVLPRRPSASILRTGSRSDLAALNEDDSGDESAMQYQPNQFRRERSMEDKKRASFSQQGPERFEFTPGPPQAARSFRRVSFREFCWVEHVVGGIFQSAT